jgi:hypothetical protein
MMYPKTLQPYRIYNYLDTNLSLGHISKPSQKSVRGAPNHRLHPNSKDYMRVQTEIDPCSPILNGHDVK